MGIDDRWMIGGGILLYTVVFISTVSLLWQNRRLPHALTFIAVALGWLLQTTGLYIRGLEIGGCPLGNAFEIIQFVIWSLITIYLIVGTAFRVSLLGFFSSGLASVLGIVSLAVPAWDSERRPWMEGASVWVELHATLALFSYGIFAILALTSAMYLLRHYSLKKKKTFTGIFHFLPSIRELEVMKFRLLLAGLLVLSSSLLIGMVNWSQIDGYVNHTKLVGTLGVWVGYTIVLILRLRQRLTSGNMAWVCVGLFFLALVSLWPVNTSRPGERAPADSARPLQF